VLTPESFELDGEEPVVRVRGAYTKNGKEAVQPLPPDIVEVLRPYLAAKPTGRPVWPGYWADHAADTLRCDLDAAGIPYVTQGPDGPEHADFHALRHSYITALAMSDTNPKLVQSLARHSTFPLTYDRYTHVRRCDQAQAIRSLPSLLPENRHAAATGTDGRPVPYTNLTPTPDPGCVSMRAVDRSTEEGCGGDGCRNPLGLQGS